VVWAKETIAWGNRSRFVTFVEESHNDPGVKSGHITIDGRGLVFAGGDTIGTANGTAASGGTAVINVFATLICENAAPFVERNTNSIVGVPLAENGDFTIDDVLSPAPPVASSCATPVLLIRNVANKNWFAAGIQKFD